MSTFPSILTSYTDPLSTDKLSNPSHSGIEQAQNSGLEQVEAVIGIMGSGVGTLVGDLRNASSDGGGHVQGVNKGGTNQTSYTKGDLLVANSTSVLAKLAVSSTYGDALIADPTQATGIKWFPAVANKITVTNRLTSITAWTSSIVNTYISASVIGGTLGINNAIRFIGQLPRFETDGGSFALKVNYGNDVAASLLTTISGYTGNTAGTIEGMIIGAQTSSQIGYIKLFTSANKGATTTASVVYGYGYGNSSVNALLDQTLNITGSVIGTATRTSIIIGFSTVEKIA